MEFLIDHTGRSRKVGNRNLPVVLGKVGYVHILSSERVDASRHAVDRTVIVTLQPQKLSDATTAALGNKLAALNPSRVVIVKDGPAPECWIFSECLAALRKVTALADDRRPDPTRPVHWLT